MDVRIAGAARLLTRAHPSKGGDAKPPVLGAISQDSGAAGSSCLRADSAPARQYRHRRDPARVVARWSRLARPCAPPAPLSDRDDPTGKLRPEFKRNASIAP